MTHVEIQALIDGMKATGGKVLIPAGEHLIGAPIRQRQDTWLAGEGHATKLIATPALDGPVIVSENVGTNRFIHGMKFTDVWVQHGQAKGGIAAVQWNRTGEQCQMDNVMVSQAYQHGVLWQNYSNSIMIGSLYAFENGRSGAGSGLMLGNPKDSPHIGFLRGNNNADALLLCRGIRDVPVHLHNFSMEHGSNKPLQQKYAIWLDQASDGAVHIGTGTILGHKASTDNPLGVAILYHSGTQKGTMHVYGGIDWFDHSGFALYYKNATDNYPEASLTDYRRRAFDNTAQKG